jgi:hypothetical protein
MQSTFFRYCETMVLVVCIVSSPLFLSLDGSSRARCCWGENTLGRVGTSLRRLEERFRNVLGQSDKVRRRLPRVGPEGSTSLTPRPALGMLPRRLLTAWSTAMVERL